MLLTLACFKKNVVTLQAESLNLQNFIPMKRVLFFGLCMLFISLRVYAQNKIANDAYYPWYIECAYDANDIIELNTEEEGIVLCNLFPADTSAWTCLLFYVEDLDTDITIPEGVYPINSSKEEGTVTANPGIEDNTILPSFHVSMTSEGYLQAPIWQITDGSVEVSKTIDNKLYLEVNAITPEEYPVHIVYNASQFPTIAGLSRTHTIEMYDMNPNDNKRSGGYPELTVPTKDTIIQGKTYLQFNEYYSPLFLREENNKILIYSSILQDDLVLYDYTLELGDSLHAITGDDWFSDDNFAKLNKAEDMFTYVVTDVSMITLLDGIERKKWILKNKYLPIIEYVDGIGCYGENTNESGDFFRLIYDHPYTTEYIGDHLVCVSQNGKLLYSMSQEEMDSFAVDCYCLSDSTESAVEHLTNSSISIQKFIYNNQLLIRSEDKTYNVMGVEVE